ncbi:T6SS effector BTH_I2691 family protein [Pseudomonas sp. BP8]|uniref:T6SS effector BTH_I2691 family protein n=1 Tax=Pseudomonas sp. BP8 TaxID=2817864 RepID=UPI001AEB254F|nr:T6SS effector BTH_I2691 family protein [Pseudomonas sp. BP8]MBP2262583.1 hypothetical protein [Pseudomonas sp. BP8]
MHKTATEAQLKQARRNQQFTNVPIGSGQCPWKHAEVAIFPVRYALDESPLEKDSNQGPHALPRDWPRPSPALQTRSYTLRQLRDGWVYVWNEVEQTFHEYQVSGWYFTRHIWTDAQLNQDVRHNPGETHQYLLYSRRSRLRIAYSPVQWTWRMCELMRSSAPGQRPWMREVDLPTFCVNGQVAHGDMITALGKSVADILVTGETPPDFTSTLLPTIATEPDAPFKAAFEEALVRGWVPEQDTALFVALDDPLAIVDDLTMNLTGRLLEQSQFESQHQDQLQSAITVQRLCGFDTDAFTPETITDPFERQAYADDLYTLLYAYDALENTKNLVDADYEWVVEARDRGTVESAHAFKRTWGHLPDQAKWGEALEEWNAKRLWREDVRFEEMQKYLTRTTAEAQRLSTHCQRSEQDLLAWLNRLQPFAEVIYYDTCNEAQASQLLNMAHALYTVLGNGEAGQAWLCKQATRPSTLFGTALFNFNPELATLFRTVSHNFSTTGALDDQGRQGDGSSPALTLTSPGDVTSVATRANELKAVLDLQAVRDSKLYNDMSSAAKQAMSTLIQVANHQAREAWHGLSGLLLPAMKHEAALTLALPQVLISTEISSSTRLAFNPTFQRDYQAWLMEVVTIERRIQGAKRVLQRPGKVHDQRAARLALPAHEEQLRHLFMRRPNQLVATAAGKTRVPVSLAQLNSWLGDLGQAEVRTQHKLMGTEDYQRRTRAWMDQNLGNALPALLVGLNAWNLYSSAQKAQNDGRFTADEWRTVAANAAYTGNALAALWVGPAWSRAGKMSAEVGHKTRSLAQAAYKNWLSLVEEAITKGEAAKAATASEFAAFSKRLIWRTITWATLGAVATGLEAWQVYKDADAATSATEKSLLEWKSKILVVMSLTSAGQLIGAGLGYWLRYAWVMSTPVTIALLLLGIAYLLVTMAANRYKREGLRLWLYRCSWGRGAKPEWLGEAGHSQQMIALLEILQRPTLTGKVLCYNTERMPTRWLGFWIQIQVPNALAGKVLTLKPELVYKRYFSKNDDLHILQDSFCGQMLNGNWVDPKQLGKLPSVRASNITPADFSYSTSDQHRLWQVWINVPIAHPTIEMEIKYPAGTYQRGDRRGYMFRLALGASTSEADRLNDAFSEELTEESGIVLINNDIQSLQLIVPNAINSEPNDV